MHGSEQCVRGLMTRVLVWKENDGGPQFFLAHCYYLVVGAKDAGNKVS